MFCIISIQKMVSLKKNELRTSKHINYGTNFVGCPKSMMQNHLIIKHVYYYIQQLNKAHWL